MSDTRGPESRADNGYVRVWVDEFKLSESRAGESVDLAARTLIKADHNGEWDTLLPSTKDHYRRIAEAALTAAVPDLLARIDVLTAERDAARERVEAATHVRDELQTVLGRVDLLTVERDAALGRIRVLTEALAALGVHPFEGVVLGVPNRPCTRCNLADRHPIHTALQETERAGTESRDRGGER